MSVIATMWSQSIPCRRPNRNAAVRSPRVMPVDASMETDYRRPRKYGRRIRDPKSEVQLQKPEVRNSGLSASARERSVVCCLSASARERSVVCCLLSVSERSEAGLEGAAGSRLTRFFVLGRLAAPLAELLQLEAVPRVGLVLRGDVIAPLALLACESDGRSLVTCHRYLLFELIRCGCRRNCRYLIILVTRPAPTVRPPSRIANLRPSSIAIGFPNTTVISVLSPGITISVPSGNETAPVTSVVRK